MEEIIKEILLYSRSDNQLARTIFLLFALIAPFATFNVLFETPLIEGNIGTISYLVTSLAYATPFFILGLFTENSLSMRFIDIPKSKKDTKIEKTKLKGKLLSISLFSLLLFYGSLIFALGANLLFNFKDLVSEIQMIYSIATLSTILIIIGLPDGIYNSKKGKGNPK